jgi:sigma-B regulation protein RsbU (phosphoserine phosphatase)
MSNAGRGLGNEMAKAYGGNSREAGGRLKFVDESRVNVSQIELSRSIFGDEVTDWRQRLDLIVETMREMSLQTDAQAMVAAYAKRMRELLRVVRSIALSRRDLEAPKYRITRSSTWKEDVNPWKQKDRLPVLEGGLLGELIYSDEPHIIDELEVDDDDPAAEYLAGQRSLVAIPNYDQGVALNMTVLMREEPAAFNREQFPELVWMSNLFGRATHNLVLNEEVRAAYEMVDHEMRIIADIQRSLLPAELPEIPTMSLAAYYQTSHRAGGDYYDFFPLSDGKWGVLIADVSGHGSPAAVVMAITHSIAHTYPGPATPPSEMLNYLNRHLSSRYTAKSGTFVTAFYGIYDPQTRELSYGSAGHNPPRLKRCAGGEIFSLAGTKGLPLGIIETERYEQRTETLRPGDQILFYTDGITEAHNPSGELFGLDRLDAVLGQCRDRADDLIEAVLAAVDEHTAGAPPSDDRTLVVAKIS